MSANEIVYTIYIAAPPEKLWEALTDPEALRQNWGRIDSTWTIGAKVTEVDAKGSVLWHGAVLESERPRKLTYTFDVAGISEPATQATFEIAPPETEVAGATPVVRLTVTQSGFEENSKLRSSCARAWPEILSSIKSFLETGHPLGFVWQH